MQQVVQRITVTLLAAALLATSVSFAATNGNSNSSMITPSEMKWSAGPDSLPKGAEFAVLEGDPSQAGPFTLRIKFPANYRIPPHWHPAIEHVTVMSGTLYMGTGDTLNEKHATELPPDSFAYMQPQMHHYAFTLKPVEVQLHGVGPWAITYVNPQDDPLNPTT